MKTPIRILLVDDSPSIRRLLGDLLSADDELVICGEAADGREGVDAVRHHAPDLVILDVEMPVMNGLEALREIRRLHPALPVIMFSAVTEKGAAATIEALSIGANDYVTKPTGAGGLKATLHKVRHDLIPTIKAIGRSKAGTAATRIPQRVKRVVTKPIEILAIGSSTGGPNALAELIPALPAGFPLPIVIVQHMPAVFTKHLAQRLSAKAQIPVEEAVDGQTLKPGVACLAPGDFHMEVKRAGGSVEIALNQGPEVNSCRPAVDNLFNSVSKIYGGATLAVVLTGMGQDGLNGCKGLNGDNAQILVQDEASSVVWGMPGHIARAGIADKVLPLGDLAAEIMKRVPSNSLPGAALRAAGGRG